MNFDLIGLFLTAILDEFGLASLKFLELLQLLAHLIRLAHSLETQVLEVEVLWLHS